MGQRVEECGPRQDCADASSASAGQLASRKSIISGVIIIAMIMNRAANSPVGCKRLLTASGAPEVRPRGHWNGGEAQQRPEGEGVIPCGFQHANISERLVVLRGSPRVSVAISVTARRNNLPSFDAGRPVAAS